MSSIGSGPGLSSGATIEVTAALAASADTRLSSSADATVVTPQATTGTTGSQSDIAVKDSTSAQAVVTTTATSAGSSPVDSDRVAAIKKAIETGNYPIVPTKIGDAMIAASMLLRTPK